ncbi:MAG: hypothetical protein ACOX5W_13585 [Bacillota bacterium]|jgi:hypothetical protein
MKVKRYMIISFLLVTMLIPTIVNADIKEAQATQIKDYSFQITNFIKTAPFNVPNTNPLYINLRQWSTSTPYNPYTINYSVYTRDVFGVGSRCSYSSSVYNYSGPAVYAEMSSTPKADSAATLEITVTNGNQAYAGYGEIYQN